MISTPFSNNLELEIHTPRKRTPPTRKLVEVKFRTLNVIFFAVFSGLISGLFQGLQRTSVEVYFQEIGILALGTLGVEKSNYL